MSQPKILSEWNDLCLFCGKEKDRKCEDYHFYHECDCKDAVEHRRIMEEIERLKRTLPKEKFQIIKKPVLYVK